GGSLEAGEINFAAEEDRFMLLREVFADDGHDAHGGEMAGGEREIAGGAAQGAVYLAKGGFDSVKGDGTDHKQRHESSDSGNIFSDDGREAFFERGRNAFAIGDNRMSEGGAAAAGARAFDGAKGLAQDALHVLRVAAQIGHHLIERDGIVPRMPAIVIG